MICNAVLKLSDECFDFAKSSVENQPADELSALGDRRLLLGRVDFPDNAYAELYLESMPYVENADNRAFVSAKIFDEQGIPMLEIPPEDGIFPSRMSAMHINGNAYTITITQER